MTTRAGKGIVVGLIALGLNALGLSGCALPQRDEAAPVTAYGVETPPPPSSGGAIVIGAGDTVYEISRRYGVPTRDIIELNGLAPPYTLFAGQRLLLPMARFHTVQRGDTLYSISRMYQVDMAELARSNDLPPPYGIRVGQMLRLPGGGDPSGTAIAAAGAVRAPIPHQKPGSRVVAPAQLPIGAPVTAPAVVASSVPILPPPMAKPATKALGGATQVAAAPAPPAARPETPAGKPVAVARSPEPPPPVQEPPARTASRFEWPVKGPILSSFGPKPGGLHNDGLNIGAPRGTPVVAVEDGIVAYAGDELRGFGNLLLIRHADRWVSAYAHLDRLMVERGAVVRRGQQIGTVGSTGSVADPQLHFELRQGSRAVDPREHLAPKQDRGRV